MRAPTVRRTCIKFRSRITFGAPTVRVMIRSSAKWLAWVLVVAALAAFAPAPSSGAASPADTPFVEATLVADVARGGSDLTVDLHGFGLTSVDYVRIEASLGGVPVLFDFYGEPSIETVCPEVVVGSETLNRCVLFAAGARTAGIHDVSVYVPAPFDEEFAVTAELAEDIPRWWETFDVTRSTDIFTGSTSMTVTFTALPAAVGALDLVALGDDDYDGVPETVMGRLDCSIASGAGTCTTTRTIPARCTEDSLGGEFCEVDPTVYFTVNGIAVPGLAYDGTHYRLSRYDEGAFFGQQDAAAGVPLGDSIDLDTYRLPYVEPCFETNAPYCFDAGYYLTWIRTWLGSIGSRSSVAATPTATGAVVRAVVPTLPAGRNGVRAEAVLTGPGGTVRRTMACDATACAPLAIDGLAPGTWSVALRLVNAHPRTTYEDESTWGGETFATITGDPVEVGASDGIAAFRGWYTRGKPATDGRIRVWGWARNDPDTTRGKLGLRAWDDGQEFVLAGGTVDTLDRSGDRIVVEGVGTVDGAPVEWTLVFVERGDVERDRIRVIVRAGADVLYDTDPGLPMDALPTHRVPTDNFSADLT